MFKEIKTRGFIKPAGFYLVKSMRKADFIYFLFSAFFRLCRAAALSPAEENTVFISTATASACEIKRKANGQVNMNYKARRLQELAGLIFALL